MNIIDKPIDELKEYENNPRNNVDAVNAVKNSIKEFGFKNPIIIDKDNVIVCGHTRLLAAKELNYETVPCIVADDLSEEQIKAFRLADNKVSELALWDYEKLNEELEGILNIDMEQFTFEKLEDINIDDIFGEQVEEPKDPEEPQKEEVQCPHCKMYFTLE